MKTLQDLPETILGRILEYLTQQEVLKLASTNFHFYQPCSKKLYKKIIIRNSPGLESSHDEVRSIDFTNSSHTVIYGFKRRVGEEAHYKLLEARIRALMLSLEVNPSLYQYIEEVTIYGKLRSRIHPTLIRFVESLSNKQIERVLITDYKLRKAVGPVIFGGGFASLKELVIDNTDQLARIGRFPNLRSLNVTLQDHSCVDQTFESLEGNGKLVASLEQLETLCITTRNQQHDLVISALNRIRSRIPFRLNLRTLACNYYHGNQDAVNSIFNLAGVVNWATIKNLQLSLGCDNADCNQECLSNLEAPSCDIRRLSIVQNSQQEIDTHKYNEIWDVKIFSLIQDFNTTELLYCSIRHRPNEAGIFVDGMEGNYLQRVQLYTQTLPEIIMSNRVILVLPNFIKTLACYEQPMNNLLWNGCKCAHCQLCLEKLDEFMMTHRYYNFKSQAFKDLISSNLFTTIGEWLARRFCSSDVIPDLDLLRYPLNDIGWDFHQNSFSIPFRCLNHKSFEEHEYDEDVEVFYDAQNTVNVCPFNETLFRSVATSISHFTDDLIMKMVQLNRGNAEDEQLDNFKDLNDGTAPAFFSRVFINGIGYFLDTELNGTSYFVAVYD